MHDRFLHYMIRENPSLFRAVCEFNLHPARYIHESRLPATIDPELFKRLQSVKRAEIRLSTLIFKSYGITETLWIEFENPFRRLVLMDGRSLMRLVYLAGITACSKWICRIIDRETLQWLKERIGDDAYWFAVRKAPYLTARDNFYVDDHEGFDDPHTWAINFGLRFLETCLGNEPESLIKRLVLKIPSDVHVDFNRSIHPDEKEGSWTIMKKILFQEADPQWATLFS